MPPHSVTKEVSKPRSKFIHLIMRVVAGSAGINPSLMAKVLVKTAKVTD